MGEVKGKKGGIPPSPSILKDPRITAIKLSPRGYIIYPIIIHHAQPSKLSLWSRRGVRRVLDNLSSPRGFFLEHSPSGKHILILGARGSLSLAKVPRGRGGGALGSRRERTPLIHPEGPPLAVLGSMPERGTPGCKRARKETRRFSAPWVGAEGMK